MAKINEIDITSLLFQEGSAPTTPASTKWRAYFKTDGLYVIDDAGTETGPLSTGGAAFSGASVYDASTQSLTNGTLTAINFDTEDYDTDTYHDNATNNTRLTVPETGKYLVVGTVGFAANGTGARTVGIRVDGTTYKTFESFAPAPTTPASRDTVVTTVRTMQLSASSYVELMARQDSGGALNSALSSGVYPRFEITKVG